MAAETQHSENAAEPVELAARTADGLRIVLLWHPRDDRLDVVVEDTRERSSFKLSAWTGKEALDAFHHPFAYAAARGVADPRSQRGTAPSVSLVRR
jgi:hypothetical protein